METLIGFMRDALADLNALCAFADLTSLGEGYQNTY
jgi:hypothetical protein